MTQSLPTQAILRSDSAQGRVRRGEFAVQISMRSHLTAGMVAVVGAGAIALAPVGPGATLPFSALRPEVPSAAAAEVALAGITLPFSDVLALLQTLGIGGAIPDISGLIPADLADAIATEFLIQATPLVTTAAIEVFGYLNTTIAGLISGPDSIPARFGAALGEVPGVLLTAFQSFSAGDVATTLQVLSSGILAPVNAIGQAVIDAGEALQSYVSTQVTAVTNALPAVLLASVSSVINNNLQSALDAVRTAISDLFNGFLPGAASVPALPRTAAASVASTASVASLTPASSAGGADAAPTAVSAVVESAAPAMPDRTTTSVRSRVRADSRNLAARTPAPATDPTGTAPSTTTPRARALAASRSAEKSNAGSTALATMTSDSAGSDSTASDSTASDSAADTASADTSAAGS